MFSGNIDTTTFGRCLERGLAAEGRLMKFTVTVSDRPGGICDLCKLIASCGVSIKDIMHERAWLKDIYRWALKHFFVSNCANICYSSVEVKCIVETADFDNAQYLKRQLLHNYKVIVAV